MSNGYTSPVFGQIMGAVGALADEAKHQRGLQEYESRQQRQFQRSLAIKDYQTLGMFSQDPNLMPKQQKQAIAGQREIAQTGAVGRQATVGLGLRAPRAEVTSPDVAGTDYEHLLGREQTLGERQRMISDIAISKKARDAQDAVDKQKRLDRQSRERIAGTRAGRTGTAKEKIEKETVTGTVKLAQTQANKAEKNVRKKIDDINTGLKTAMLDSDNPKYSKLIKYYERAVTLSQQIQRKQYSDPGELNTARKELANIMSVIDAGEEAVLGSDVNSNADETLKNLGY